MSHPGVAERARYVSRGRYNLGDYGSSRTDAMASTWAASAAGMTPNTTFADPMTIPTWPPGAFPGSRTTAPSTPSSAWARCSISTSRAARICSRRRITDRRRTNVDFAGRFNPAAGTSANPGAFATANSEARGWDPRYLLECQPLAAPGGEHSPATSRRPQQHCASMQQQCADQHDHPVGPHRRSASSRECGRQGAWLDGKLFFTGAAFQQRRTDVSENDDPTVISAYPLRRSPAAGRWSSNGCRLRETVRSGYARGRLPSTTPTSGAAARGRPRARLSGHHRCAGHVIYPAEAFLYGGRSYVQLPNGMPQYATKQGNPPPVGFAASYQPAQRSGLHAQRNYFSSTCSGRLCLVRLPSADVFNVGTFWNLGAWSLKLDIFNVANERYFRARTGDTLGDVLAQAMPIDTGNSPSRRPSETHRLKRCAGSAGLRRGLTAR